MSTNGRADTGPARGVLLTLGLLLTAAALYGWQSDPVAFHRAYIVAFLYVLAPSVGSLGLLLLHQLTGGRWGDAIGGILTGATRVLPFLAVAAIPIFLGAKSTYPWAAPGAAEELTAHQAQFLSMPFVIGRAVAYFGLWIFLATQLRRRAGTPSPLLGGFGLGLVILSMSVAAVDWGMSLSGHWYSSIYGLLMVLGQALSALSLATFVLILLTKRARGGQPATEVLQDLGTLLFALVLTWMYLAFSQLLIIWSANLPEQATWYVRRLGPHWRMLATVVVVLHFFLPFALLLMRKIKRKGSYLAIVCALVFGARLPELLWAILPSFHADTFHLGWIDFVLPFALLCLWGWAFLGGIETRPSQDRRAGALPREATVS